MLARGRRAMRSLSDFGAVNCSNFAVGLEEWGLHVASLETLRINMPGAAANLAGACKSQ